VTGSAVTAATSLARAAGRGPRAACSSADAGSGVSRASSRSSSNRRQMSSRSAGTLRAASRTAQTRELVEKLLRLVRLPIGEQSVRSPPGGVAVHRGE
jgi:hypothetical protein